MESYRKRNIVEQDVYDRSIKNDFKKALRGALIAAGVSLASLPVLEQFPTASSDKESSEINVRGILLESSMRYGTSIKEIIDYKSPPTIIKSVHPLNQSDIESIENVVQKVLKDTNFKIYDPKKIEDSYTQWSLAPSSKELFKKVAINTVQSGEIKEVLQVIHVASMIKDISNTEVDEIIDRVSHATSTNIALLANNVDLSLNDTSKINLRDYLIMGDESLAYTFAIPEKLVQPLVTHSLSNDNTLKDMRDYFNKQPRSIYKDAQALLMTHISKKNEYLDPIELKQSGAIVARNLFFAGYYDQPTNKMISDEVDSINKRRAELGATTILDSKIVLISNVELITAPLFKNESYYGTPRFGTIAFSQKLQNFATEHHAKDPHTFISIAANHYNKITNEYTASPDMAKKARHDAIVAISDGREASTIILDGHGSEEAFALSNGEPLENGEFKLGEYLSVSDIVNALSKRWHSQQKNFPHETEINVSLIFSACMQQNFIRAIADELATRNIPLPRLMMSASEYKQYGFSNYFNSFGSEFNEYVIKNPTIKELIEHKKDVINNTPSIFVPRKDDPHKLMQLGGIVIPASANVDTA